MSNATPSSYLYIRALRHADHTVFSVADGQKTYWDPQFGRQLAYSSGQQVKRSILDKLTDLLGTGRAPVEFIYKIDKTKKTINEDIARLSTHPKYADELLGGYMLAEAKGTQKEDDKEASVIKRRSPLSISAMRPLHPLLAGVAREEAITFDRTGDANSSVVLLDENGKQLSLNEMQTKLDEANKVLRKAKFVDTKNQRRAYGLYIYDIAIDLRRLFSVSADLADPEIKTSVRKELEELGWIAGKNAFGPCLTAPKAERDRIIPALAEALLEWSIGSNQARTYAPPEVLAISLGTRVHNVTTAIRAELEFGAERPAAQPVLDNRTGSDLYVTLHAPERVAGANGNPTALDDARSKLIALLEAYPYEG
jgi:hypothetical protein